MYGGQRNISKPKLYNGGFPFQYLAKLNNNYFKYIFLVISHLWRNQYNNKGANGEIYYKLMCFSFDFIPLNNSKIYSFENKFCKCACEEEPYKLTTGFYRKWIYTLNIEYF